MYTTIYSKKKTFTLRTNIFIFSFLLGISLVQAQSTISRRANFGIVYPLSSNGRNAMLDTNQLSVHLIAGISSVEEGCSIAGFSNLVLNEAKGAQLAGFSNHIGGTVKGLQMAGFLNTYKGGEGASFAGFANISTTAFSGVQLAGFANLVGDIQGSQFAGFYNHATGVRDSQFAGFMNKATRVNDSQFAGFMNVADEVDDSQFAGFLNIAHRVRGVQVSGFMNIASYSDYPIGFLNLIEHGEKSFSISMDEMQNAMLGFRSGGSVLYGLLSLGYQLKSKESIYVAEAGLGAHFFEGAIFRINTEIFSQSHLKFASDTYLKAGIRALPELRLGNIFSLTGGPSLNIVYTNSKEGTDWHKTSDFPQWWKKEGRYFKAIYPGYYATVQFRF